MGINLDQRFTLQFAPGSDSVTIELLDTSLPTAEGTTGDAPFAESRSSAAAAGLDVFAIAKSNPLAKWKRVF